MALSDELRDPWALLVAGLAGGAAWAVGVPVAVAAGVGAAVLGIKAAAGVLIHRDRPLAGRELPVRNQSPEERWLHRADRALRSFQELASSATPGPIAERCRAIGDQAATTREVMRRLAGQVSSVGVALRRVDVARLSAEESRLAADLRAAGAPGVRAELERSLDSIRQQLQVGQRLQEAGRTLLARLESSTLGLEGLVARLAEVLALSQTATTPAEGAQQIDALADELEGLRSGLAETEQISRGALSAFQARGSVVHGTARGRPPRSRERG